MTNSLMSCSSSVHTTSSNTHPAPRSYRQRLLSSGDAEEMSAVEQLYRLLSMSFSAARLSECRQSSWFARHNATGKVSVLAKSCHVRFCPLCGKSRRNAIQANTYKWLRSATFPKMVTLTMAHCDDLLAMQLDRLYKAFKDLRRLSLWKKNVTGLIWFFELKLTGKGEWHPHLHILIDGRYLPQRALSRAWKKKTGDSYIVDVRAVKDKKKAAFYVSKYATKPISVKNVPAALYREFFGGMSKRRLCGAAGTARVSGVLTRPVFVSTDWERIGSWSVVTANLHSDAVAQCIWRAYLDGTPLEPGVSMLEIDRFLDGNDWEASVHEKMIVEDKLLF